MKNTKLLKMVFLAMMVAVGVVISPILRVEGMCPMAHFINVTCAVFLGPWYAFVLNKFSYYLQFLVHSIGVNSELTYSYTSVLTFSCFIQIFSSLHIV